LSSYRPISLLPTLSHDASLSRVILHLVFLCPQTAFSLEETLLPLLLKGVQNRIESPNDIDRRIAMRVAHAFSVRTQDQMLKRSADMAGKAADNDDDRKRIVKDFADLGDEQGGDIELDVSAKHVIEKLRATSTGPIGAFVDRFAYTEIESISDSSSSITSSSVVFKPSDAISSSSSSSSSILIPSLTSISRSTIDVNSQDITSPTNSLISNSNTNSNFESVLHARHVFASKAPQSLTSAYNRLISYIKEDGGGGGNAMPIPGGSSLDEDTTAISGTPDGTVALFSTLERLVRSSAEDDTGNGQSLLIELAVPILNALFTSSNRYELRDVPAWRFASMVAITSCAVPLACAHIINRISLSHDSTEVTKMEALDVLVAAARELSPSLISIQDIQEGKQMDVSQINYLIPPLPPWERKNWLPDIVDDINNIDTTSSQKTGNLVDECEEDRKKAFYETSIRVRIDGTKTNLFATVTAQHFFFPLIHILTSPSIRKNLKKATKFNTLNTSSQNTLLDIEEEEDIGISKSKSTTSTSLLSLALGQGENIDNNNSNNDDSTDNRLFELLTSQSIRGLAVFLELSGEGVDTIKMARALLPLAWVARTGGILLRRSSLSSIAAVIACSFRCGESLLFSSSVLDTIAKNIGVASSSSSSSSSTLSLPSSSSTSETLRVLSTVSQRVAVQMTVDSLNRIAVDDVLSRNRNSKENFTKYSDRNTNNDVDDTITEVFQDDLVKVVQWMKSIEENDIDEQCRMLARMMLYNPILKEVLQGSA
jgi:hypothetical protein